MYSIYSDIELEFPEYCNNEFLKQGYWGEMLVKRILEQNGHFVIMNPDVYGSWDMVSIHKISGKSKSIQVKTLSRYVTKNYFGISSGKTQKALESIKECDKLVLVVRTPPTFHDSEFSGLVLDVLNHKNFTSQYGSFIIPDTDSNFNILYKMTEDELMQVNSFDTRAENRNI